MLQRIKDHINNKTNNPRERVQHRGCSPSKSFVIGFSALENLDFSSANSSISWEVGRGYIGFVGGSFFSSEDGGFGFALGIEVRGSIFVGSV